jgi:ABC-type transport system involved in multi-copper enzyme maturation permease subunit
MTITGYRSELPVGDDGFPSLLRSEWTKFRTVRGWVVGLLTAAVVTVLVSLLGATGSNRPCRHGCTGPVGPGGEGVVDAFYFVHQPLTGDGSITVRVASLKSGTDTGLEPWAKAGLIVKASTAQGSSYAAVMLTGGHGVRMQWDYVHDKAGSTSAAASPRWLRLTRSGATLTGSESADGTNWTQIGTAHLSGLPSTVQAGMFVASPDHVETTVHFGGTSSIGGLGAAIADFDQVSLQGQPGGNWAGTQIEGGSGGPGGGQFPDFHRTGGTFTVEGTGDIAPAVGGLGTNTIDRSLVGAFAGLIVMIVLGTMFITAEYRRGLIRTTLTATPRRGRVLAAKAVVLGGLAFLAALAASALAFWLVGGLRRSKGDYSLPVSTLTEVRVVVGTAGILAVTAVLALAVGSVLRRSAGAVTAVVVLTVLPYILAVASVLPAGPAQWLLRVTPAAAFAIQQSIPEYAQVSTLYTPSNGYFPLAPWVGFAVLCAWTAAALALAAALLRRRDA